MIDGGPESLHSNVPGTHALHLPPTCTSSGEESLLLLGASIVPGPWNEWSLRALEPPVFAVVGSRRCRARSRCRGEAPARVLGALEAPRVHTSPSRTSRLPCECVGSCPSADRGYREGQARDSHAPLGPLVATVEPLSEHVHVVPFHQVQKQRIHAVGLRVGTPSAPGLVHEAAAWAVERKCSVAVVVGDLDEVLLVVLHAWSTFIHDVLRAEEAGMRFRAAAE